MVSPGDISGAFNIGFGGVLNKFIVVMGYVMIALAVAIMIWVIYLFITYKYKTEIYVRRNMGKSKEGGYSIGKIKRDWIREVKIKGVRKWKFLLGRKMIEPMDDKYILPGNKVKLFQVSPDSFVPVVFRASNPEAVFEPLPQNIRFWEQLEIQQANQDYQSQKFWDKYGAVAVMAGTILFCLILVGVVTYFTYNHANSVTAGLQQVSKAFELSTMAQGLAPG